MPGNNDVTEEKYPIADGVAQDSDVAHMVVPSEMHERRSSDHADPSGSNSTVKYFSNHPNADSKIPRDAHGNQSETCVVNVNPCINDLDASKNPVVIKEESKPNSTHQPTSAGPMEKPYALTRFPISAADPFSIMLLMCCSAPVMFAVVIIRALPVVIVASLFSWLELVKDKKRNLIYGFYESKPPGPDYVVIALVHIGIITPKFLRLYSPLTHFKDIVLFSYHASPYFLGVHWRMFGCSFVCFIVDLLFAPLFSMILSLYIALYLSEGSLLNVLLNAVALEFINELDAAILKTFVDVWYRGASISMMIKAVRRVHTEKPRSSKSRSRKLRPWVGHPDDFAYVHSADAASNEEKFWQKSDAGENAVFELLKERTNYERNADRWCLLTDSERGLGLSSGDVHTFVFELQIMDLVSLKESRIASEGKKMLTVMDDTDWIDTLTNRQRELFRWYHPIATFDFPIVGVSVRLRAASLLEMTPALKKCETLRTLNIAVNLSRGAMVKRMTAIFQENQWSSKDVVDSSRKRYREVGKAVSSILEVNRSLERIIIDGAVVKITHRDANKEKVVHFYPEQLTYDAWFPLVEGLKHILTGLTWPTQLQTPDATAVMLGNILEANNTLKNIELADVNVSHEAGHPWAGRMTRIDSLTTLALPSFSIRDAGAAVLGNMLRRSKTLKELDLKDNELTEAGCRALAEGIEHNHSLTALDLQANKLGDAGMSVIGAILKSCGGLKKLNLSANQVGDDGCYALVKSMGFNESLTDLDLQENMIGDEGAGHIGTILMTSTRLQKLNLKHNLVTDKGCALLANFIRNNRNSILTELDLQMNKVEVGGATCIGRMLKTNTVLKKLNLSHNMVTDDGCRALTEGLTHNSILTELDLSGNKIGDAGAIAVGTMLKSNTALEKLHLGCEVSREGCQALAEGLTHNSILTELELYHNNIGDAGVMALGHMLKTNRGLAKLNLRSNIATDKGCQALVEGMTHNSILTEVELSVNKISDAGTVALGRMLKTNRALTKLGLSGNQVTDEGCRMLAEGLRHNSTLKEVDLLWNKIGGAGAVAFGKMLKTNRALTKLDLSINHVTDRGCQAVAEGLAHHTILTGLYLRNSKIGDAGAVAIGYMLKTNKALTTLDFSNNQIESRGCQALAEGIMQNSIVKELNLEKNNIGDGGLGALGNMLRINKSLATLNLGSNNVQDEACRAVAEGLVHNSTLSVLRLKKNKIGDGGAMAIGDMLKTNRELKLIDLNHNLVADGGCRALAGGLVQNCILTSLLIEKNKIENEGYVAAIGRMLRANRKF
eukprot:GEMP01000280.1.p1 GENE.GEMP01000280.1~~GEMP01000280.1.p1  ORF type:complete len:1292 (+),score=221.04 GEMP01000280.1:388-4263(+)